jgi:hypothetical protein
MHATKTGVGAALGTIALVATLTLAGGGAAQAKTVTPNSGESAASCWIDASTMQSLCVSAGTNLLAAVSTEAGVDVSVPVGTPIGGVKTKTIASTTALVRRGLVHTAASAELISAIYDDINYGGGTYLLTSPGGNCDSGLPSLVPYGWNDRVSSFKSYDGCITALFRNTNYGGTRVGYSTNKSSLGSFNDQASSWATE